MKYGSWFVNNNKNALTAHSPLDHGTPNAAGRTTAMQEIMATMPIHWRRRTILAIFLDEAAENEIESFKTRHYGNGVQVSRIHIRTVLAIYIYTVYIHKYVHIYMYIYTVYYMNETNGNKGTILLDSCECLWKAMSFTQRSTVTCDAMPSVDDDKGG